MKELVIILGIMVLGIGALIASIVGYGVVITIGFGAALFGIAGVGIFISAIHFGEDFIPFSALSLIVGVILLCIYGCVGTTSNVDYLKEQAPSYFSERNMEVIANEGYVRSATWGKNHGGGKMWYHVSYTNKPEVVYQCYLTRWGKDNIQLMSFKPINKYVIVDGNGDVSVNLTN